MYKIVGVGAVRCGAVPCGAVPCMDVAHIVTSLLPWRTRWLHWWPSCRGLQCKDRMPFKIFQVLPAVRGVRDVQEPRERGTGRNLHLLNETA